MQHLYHSHFERQRRLFKLRVKIYVVILLIFFLAIEVIYFVRQSEFFKIKRIEVVGFDQESKQILNNVEAGILNNMLVRFLGPENYLTWPNKIAFENLEFTSLIIDKDFYNRTITITGEKRERFGVWCIKSSSATDAVSLVERCWWFDKQDGAFLDEGPIPDGQLVLKVTAQGTNYPKPGETVLLKELFENFKKILAGLPALNVSFKNLIVDMPHQELKVETAEQSLLLFNLRFDPTPTVLPALSELLTHNQLSKIEYVDLTVDNKVYLKLR